MVNRLYASDAAQYSFKREFHIFQHFCLNQWLRCKGSHSEWFNKKWCIVEKPTQISSQWWWQEPYHNVYSTNIDILVTNWTHTLFWGLYVVLIMMKVANINKVSLLGTIYSIQHPACFPPPWIHCGVCHRPHCRTEELWGRSHEKCLRKGQLLLLQMLMLFSV